MFLSPFFTLSNLDTYTSKRLLRANHECRVRSERRKRRRHSGHTCSSPYSSRLALAGYGKSAWPRRKITTDPFRAQDADRKPKLVYGIERTLPRDPRACLYPCTPQGAAALSITPTGDGLRSAQPPARCGIRARALAAGHFNQRVSRHPRQRVRNSLLRDACGLCRHAVFWLLADEGGANALAKAKTPLPHKTKTTIPPTLAVGRPFHRMTCHGGSLMFGLKLKDSL